MTALAPTVQAFFTERLPTHTAASPHTVAAYRDTWRLLLGFAAQRPRSPADTLDCPDLDAELIGAFLTTLETRARTTASPPATPDWPRSTRSFAYAALRHPEHADHHRPGARHPRQTQATAT